MYLTSSAQTIIGLTPGITRRETLTEAFYLADGIRALSGRVHAIVRFRAPSPRRLSSDCNVELSIQLSASCLTIQGA